MLPMHPKVKAGRQTRICRSQCHKNLNVTKISMSQKCEPIHRCSQCNAMHPKVKAGKQTSSNKELQISMSQKYEYHKDLNVTKMHCYAFNASQSHSRERQTSSNEELQISMSQPSTMKSKYGQKKSFVACITIYIFVHRI